MDITTILGLVDQGGVLLFAALALWLNQREHNARVELERQYKEEAQEAAKKARADADRLSALLTEFNQAIGKNSAMMDQVARTLERANVTLDSRGGD